MTLRPAGLKSSRETTESENMRLFVLLLMLIPNLALATQCKCPFDMDSLGRTCGNRSQFCRQGTEHRCGARTESHRLQLLLRSCGKSVVNAKDPMKSQNLTIQTAGPQ